MTLSEQFCGMWQPKGAWPTPFWPARLCKCKEFPVPTNSTCTWHQFFKLMTLESFINSENHRSQHFPGHAVILGYALKACQRWLLHKWVEYSAKACTTCTTRINTRKTWKLLVLFTCEKLSLSFNMGLSESCSSSLLMYVVISNT